MKRTGWVLVFVLLLSPALYAWDITVGSSFKILEVARAGEKIIFPLERKKYANIRVLNRATYQELLRCADPCKLAGEIETPRVALVRPASTQKNMWIAQVDYLPAWRLTFLVFKKGDNFSIRFPEHVEFLNQVLKERTQEVILQAIDEENK
ncbi:MAG: hypothetical protein J6Y17_00805 [Elusimicrobiaceae bacterium]|nr:hypothetical protein [Elusimicrobiaceae bacterium]